MFHPFVLWLIAGAILFAVEMVTGASVALSFGVGCASVAIIEAITNKVFIVRDLMLFAVFSVGSFVALRQIFGHKGDSRAVETDINRY
jgi:membrane protein implicated in regulation of membrane protease activity